LNDPFEFEMSAGLGVFLEDRSQTIGTNYSNATWMRDGFGNSVLTELSKLPFYCAGKVFGTQAGRSFNTLHEYGQHGELPRQSIARLT